MPYGTISKGHGVASGIAEDPRYPEGTLKMQWPFFQQSGIPLNGLHQGTINVNIAPDHYVIGKPAHRIMEVNWSEFIPPENFLFFDLNVKWKGSVYSGLIYMPDPETKTDHHQDPHVLEFLLPKLPDVRYGMRIGFDIPEEQLKITS